VDFFKVFPGMGEEGVRVCPVSCVNDEAFFFYCFTEKGATKFVFGLLDNLHREDVKKEDYKRCAQGCPVVQWQRLIYASHIILSMRWWILLFLVFFPFASAEYVHNAIVAENELAHQISADVLFPDCEASPCSFTTNKNLFRSGEHLIYKDGVMLEAPTNITYRLVYPEGWAIPTGKNLTFFITPEPDFITSDGRSTIVLWERVNTSSLELMAWMEPTPPIDRGGGWIALGLSLLIFGGLFLLRRKKELPIYEALVEREKKVVDVLKKRGGEEWQKTLTLKTGLTKVQLSRTLKSLERRGVIEKEQWGNTNKIRLK